MLSPSNDPIADPFGERPRKRYSRKHYVLGALFQFDSNSAALLMLVDAAFAGLPRHKLLGRTPKLVVQLRLHADRTLGDVATPPALRFHAGAGLICATADAANYAVVAPAQGTALVILSRDMLRFAYHARYELIEFAVYTLATRCLGLVPLHAACVARNGKGLLLIGNSGAGKSTLALWSMLAGMDLVAEDALFVAPNSLLATAVATFLHIQPHSLRFLPKAAAARIAADSPTIKRRSGLAKLEVDLRAAPWRISRRPVRLVAMIFLSKAVVTGKLALIALNRQSVARRLNRTQPFARGHDGWPRLRQLAATLPAFKLPRGRRPAHCAEVLEHYLAAQ